VYTKYENNPFKIVVSSLQKPNSIGGAGTVAKAADKTKTKVTNIHSDDQ
jgi:hypothetical protein